MSLLATKRLTKFIFYHTRTFGTKQTNVAIWAFSICLFSKVIKIKNLKKWSRIKKSITKKDLKLQYGNRIRETYYLNTWKCDNRVLSGIMETFFFTGWWRENGRMLTVTHNYSTNTYFIHYGLGSTRHFRNFIERFNYKIYSQRKS